MALEFQIVNGRKVLFRAPLQRLGDEGGEPSLEIDEDEIDKLVNLYSIAANERRFRIMMEFMRKGEMHFSDILDVAENPKLVRDCMQPLMEEGLVVHEGRGSSYRPTRTGAVFALTLTAGLARLYEFLESEPDEVDSDE